MCRSYEFQSSLEVCYNKPKNICCLLDARVRYCHDQNSERCCDEWGKGIKIVAIPMPCSEHLGKSKTLQKAARNYNLKINSEKASKLNQLAPDVRERILGFKDACLEDLFARHKRLVNKFVDHWGIPPTAETSRGRESIYWHQRYLDAFDLRGQAVEGN